MKSYQKNEEFLVTCSRSLSILVNINSKYFKTLKRYLNRFIANFFLLYVMYPNSKIIKIYDFQSKEFERRKIYIGTESIVERGKKREEVFCKQTRNSVASNESVG